MSGGLQKSRPAGSKRTAGRRVLSQLLCRVCGGGFTVRRLIRAVDFHIIVVLGCGLPAGFNFSLRSAASLKRTHLVAVRSKRPQFLVVRREMVR
jgi:hypothetical protein